MQTVSEPKIYWQPHPGPQTEVLTRTEFEILFGGARGGGKTEGGLAWFVRWVHIPTLRGLVIRKNAADLDAWIDRARSFYRARDCSGTVVGNPPEIRFPSGAKIVIGHFKDDNAYTKYQGQEFQKMLVEELTQIESEENYLKLTASCRSTIPTLKPQVFATTNPGGVGHEWVKKRFGISGAPNEPIETVDPISGRRRVFIPSRLSDNPTLVKNDPTYSAFLDSLPEQLRKAWKEGNWDIFAGQFFAEWHQEKHIVDPFTLPYSWRRIRGIDVSGRNGVTACVWFAIDTDGGAWLYREYYGTGKDSDEHAREIARLSGEEEYVYSVVDTAAFSKLGLPETTAEIYLRNGVYGLVPSSKSRVMGWDLMHQFLRWDDETLPRLRVFKTCPQVIRTIPTLVHDDRVPEDVDTTGDDHLADAIRYALQTLRDSRSAEEKKSAAPAHIVAALERLKRSRGESGPFSFDY